MSFTDLLEANKVYAEDFAHGGFDGIARAGVAILTCMDSRIQPLEMVGLHIGDVKILRSTGGRVSPSMMTGLVLSVQLLQVERIMIVPHTRCAMAAAGPAAARCQPAGRRGRLPGPAHGGGALSARRVAPGGLAVLQPARRPAVFC